MTHEVQVGRRVSEKSPPPVVSICIPTFNRLHHLKTTLESVGLQTFRDYEILVGDDASDDQSHEYLMHLDEPRLRILRSEQNRGLAETMTQLFTESVGRYVAMLHDHDLYCPEYLERMVSLLNSQPHSGFALCAYQMIDEEGRGQPLRDIEEFEIFGDETVISGRSLIEILAKRWKTPVPAMGTVFRREIVAQVGGYRPEWGLASDEDLYRRMAYRSSVSFCGERLFSMRERPPERRLVHGSWRAIYTLYEFRRDTTNRYVNWNLAKKQTNIFALYCRKNFELCREAISLWIAGNRFGLRCVFDPVLERELPSRRPAQSTIGRVTTRILISVLLLLLPVGEAMGRMRKIARNWWYQRRYSRRDQG